MAKSRRIVIVANDCGSFAARRINIAAAAIDAGFDVHVALPTHRVPEHGVENHADLPAGEARRRIAEYPFQVHDFELSRRGLNPVQEYRTLCGLRRIYREIRPALVHHFTIKPILYGTAAACSTKVPIVINSFVGLGYLFAGKGVLATFRQRAVLRAYGSLARSARAYSIFQNTESMERMRDGASLVLDHTLYVPGGSGVDLKRFTDSPLPDGIPIVMLPARMLWDKGVGEFVEAAKLIKESGIGARFILVGSIDKGNPAAISEAKLSEWVTAGIVEWWGHRTDMPSVYRSATIVCLPSYAEGVPRALIEAAASGRPIVATNIAGCRDIVVDGHNGILVPPRNAGQLARALRELLRDQKAQRNFGHAGRAVAERDFGVDRVARATVQLYSRLIAF